MSIQNKYMSWTFKASNALDNLTAGTGHLYKAVSNGAGDIAANGKASGILQQGGPSGGHISFGYAGIMKFVAGAAVSSKDVALTVTTSGYFVEATSGTFIVGRYLGGTNNAIAISSGSVGTGMFDFTKPTYVGCDAAAIF